jgi:hypothetical protein
MNNTETSSAVSSADEQLIDAVEHYIDIQGWWKEKVAYEGGRIGFGLRFKMQHASYRVFFDVVQDLKRFAVYCYSPVDIPEGLRLQVAEFCARANYRIYNGKLEIHMDEGTIRYFSAVVVEGSTLSSEMISLMENSAICGMDEHFPAIMTIVHGGKTAREAFDSMLADSEQSAAGDELKSTVH